ncbi:unnamed protein product [Lampetra fluviatilis]
MHSTMWLLSVAFASLVLYLMLKSRSLRQKLRFFLLMSLIISQVIFNSIQVVFYILLLCQYQLSRAMCAVYFLILFSTLNNELFSVMAMSVDRYVAICWSLRVRNAVITIALVAASGPFALFLAEEILAERHNPNMICTVDNVTLFNTGQMRVVYSVFRVCASSLVVVISYILIYREGRRSGVFSVENTNARRSILYHGLQLSLFILPTILLQVLAAFGRRIAITFQMYEAILMTHLVVFSVAQGLGLVIYGVRITHLRNSMCRVLGINRAAIGVHS